MWLMVQAMALAFSVVVLVWMLAPTYSWVTTDVVVNSLPLERER